MNWYLKVLLLCKEGYVHLGAGAACQRTGALMTLLLNGNHVPF